MLDLSKYDVYIFDCDGVILNSNELKIDAMKGAVKLHVHDDYLIEKCIAYFCQNFGKSRFHHVEVFVNKILLIEECKKKHVKDSILSVYAEQCRKLYLQAELTPGFIDFLTHLKGKKYVASGSEQQELRDVFKQRGINKYFDGIFGSPTGKSVLIRSILEMEASYNAIMFGDAESDLIAAQSNNIGFVFYSPFSSVKEKMLSICSTKQLPVINSFEGMVFNEFS